MPIATIKSDIAALKAAILNKQPSPILRALAPVCVDGADVLDIFIDPAHPLFGSVSSDDKAECKVMLDECCAELKKQIAKPPAVADGGTVGKLFPGDGSFLKAMLELLLKLAPLFIEPAPEPA